MSERMPSIPPALQTSELAHETHEAHEKKTDTRMIAPSRAATALHAAIALRCSIQIKLHRGSRGYTRIADYAGVTGE